MKTNKTQEILTASGFRLINSCDGPKAGWSDRKTNASAIEFWAGPKGMVIVQFWGDGNGVSVYADWPLGSTFDDLHAALK